MSLAYTSHKNDTQSHTQLLNRLNVGNLFDLNSLPLSIFAYDQDFVEIIFLKNKLVNLYKKHITESKVINNTINRLYRRDFIHSSHSNTKREQAVNGQNKLITEFTIWLTDYVKVKIYSILT